MMKQKENTLTLILQPIYLSLMSKKNYYENKCNSEQV